MGKKLKELQALVAKQRDELDEVKANLADPEKAKAEALKIAELEKEQEENKTLLEAAAKKAEEVAAAAAGDIHTEISDEEAAKTRKKVKGLLNE